MTKDTGVRMVRGSVQPTSILKLMVAFSLIVFFCTGCATWKLGSAGQKKIKNKTYIIIGASSGFGRGMAEELGRYGANVVIAARRTELLEEIATKIRASGGKALVITTDISQPAMVDHLADTTLKVFGT